MSTTSTTLLIVLLSSAPFASAFFFGGGGGGCGCQPAPACAPPVPSPCGGGGPVVSGYVGPAAYQGGYASPPQQPLPIAPAPYQGGYQQAPIAPVAPQPVPFAPQPVQTAPVQVSAPQGYQQGPAAVAVAAPTENAAYGAAEEEVAVAALAREEPNYQGTNSNLDQSVVEAAEQAVAELHNEKAAAAASKLAEVVEERPKTKDTGKTAHQKTVKSTTTTAAPGEFPSGEEFVPESDAKEVDISELQLTDDPLCNSEDLRKLVVENIDEQLNSSKRMIQLAAEAQFGGRFDVICANGDFSYVTNTELYCQESKGDISCYTYRQL
ncbi:unnamed protein product [Caenorhabditis angaria]|uniref:Ground-like domain-containing protein n=1 Tax=Caenorhabditis angaria TaxID=860376 RepID=A0A9P1IW38_9PELO|nr:unnamed protein product [Caenorhabditis angaria]